MGWTKLGTLAFFLVIIFTVSVFCGHFGYTVDGVPQGASIEGQPGLLGAISWASDAFGFLFNLMTFQVDNTPELIGIIFIIMSLLSLTILVMMFLPGGSG